MKLYGVFSQGKFALTYKKKLATDYVKEHGGEVRWIEDDPAYHSFDSRTFRMISYPIGEGFNTFGAKKTRKNPVFSDHTFIGKMKAKKIGQWQDLVAYYLAEDGNVYAYGTTGKWVNDGDYDTFKVRVQNNQYRGKFKF